MGRPSIDFVDVHKRYRVYKERYRSLKEVLFHRRLGEWEDHPVLNGLTLEVHSGRTLGVIGSNGAGKSTTLKLMSRILVPDRGRVLINGRVSGLLELGAGFQPDYTGRENVYLNASLFGLSRRDIKAKLDSIVGFAELEEHIDAPLRTYSTGMYMRLGFAVAIHVEPEILLVDEVLAVGDEAFQHKCLDWLQHFQQDGGTIVMVSHSLGTVRELCDQVAWLDNGRVRLLGEARDVVDAYVNQVREDMQIREDIERAQAGGAGDAALVPAVELGQAQLIDAAGRAVTEVELGSSLTVDVPYVVHRRLDTPVFGIAIHRNDGVLVYASNTDLDRVELGPLTCDGRIQLTYAELGLLPGTYRVTVSVLASSLPGEPAVDSHWQRYAFRIRSEQLGEKPAERIPEQGVVRLEHRWHQFDGAVGSAQVERQVG